MVSPGLTNEPSLEVLTDAALSDGPSLEILPDDLSVDQRYSMSYSRNEGVELPSYSIEGDDTGGGCVEPLPSHAHEGDDTMGGCIEPFPVYSIEVEDPEGIAGDATEWKFLFYANYEGGVTINIDDVGDIEKAIPIIRQSLKLANS